ncbi:MAG: metallopeptidase family protein [Patescibacteria group bacterium]
MITPEQFEKLVDEAIETFPKKLREAMGNVVIVIEDLPRPGRTGEVEIHRGTILLGLYQGVPQNVWGRDRASGIPPDKITIFQASIESFAHTEAELRDLVKDVVWHEIGHHFGFNEKEIHEIEERRKQQKKKD